MGNERVNEEPIEDRVSLPPTFADWFRGYLIKRGGSQKEFAQEAGLSQAIISNARTGKRPVSPPYLKRIVEATTLSEDERLEIVRKYVGEPEELGEVLPWWKRELIDLNQQNLKKMGFATGAEFLLVRYMNLMGQIGNTIDRRTLDRRDPTVEVLLDAFRFRRIISD